MRSNSLVWRRLTLGIVLSIILVGALGISMPAVAQDVTGQPVAVGTTLQAGELAVMTDVSSGSAVITAGYDDGTFYVDGSNTNAFAPYDSYDQAIDGACRTAQDWIDQGWWPSATVNGQNFTDMDSCLALAPVGVAPDDSGSAQVADDSASDSGDTSGAPITASTDPSSLGNDNLVALPSQQDGTQSVGDGATGDCTRAAGWTGEESSGGGDFSGSIYDTQPINGAPDPADYDTNPIKRIPEGACRNAGLVVMRFVNNQARTIDVSVRILDGQEVVFGKDGEIALDGWEGYGSPVSAAVAACGQALGDFRTTDDANSWNFAYTVTFNEGPVPSTCE